MNGDDHHGVSKGSVQLIQVAVGLLVMRGTAVVDPPLPGGLSLHDTEAIIRAVAAQFRIRAAALATFHPDRAHNDKTLRAALDIIEMASECCSG